MRIVIDTNIVVSAIFFGGKPRELINLLTDGKIDVFTTKEIIDEYQKTIQYLLDKYKAKNITVPLSYIVSSMEVIETRSNVKICRDPDDDKFVNCAIDSKSIYIVSGDKDLLVLKQYEEIEIITVSDFLEKMNEGIKLKR